MFTLSSFLFNYVLFAFPFVLGTNSSKLYVPPDECVELLLSFNWSSRIVFSSVGFFFVCFVLFYRMDSELYFSHSESLPLLHKTSTCKANSNISIKTQFKKLCHNITPVSAVESKMPYTNTNLIFVLLSAHCLSSELAPVFSSSSIVIYLWTSYLHAQNLLWAQLVYCICFVIFPFIFSN